MNFTYTAVGRWRNPYNMDIAFIYSKHSHHTAANAHEFTRNLAMLSLAAEDDPGILKIFKNIVFVVVEDADALQVIH